eukprot:2935223-Amphidinium_carterae.1
MMSSHENFDAATSSLRPSAGSMTSFETPLSKVDVFSLSSPQRDLQTFLLELYRNGTINGAIRDIMIIVTRMFRRTLMIT